MEDLLRDRKSENLQRNIVPSDKQATNWMAAIVEVLPKRRIPHFDSMSLFRLVRNGHQLDASCINLWFHPSLS